MGLFLSTIFDKDGMILSNIFDKIRIITVEPYLADGD